MKSAAGLTPPYAIEVVKCRLVNGADPATFLETNQVVSMEFTGVQPGFPRRALTCSADAWQALCRTFKAEVDGAA